MYIALSLCLPVFFGMGWVVLHLNGAILAELTATRQEAARLMSLVLMLGLLCNYALVLLVRNLAVSFGIAGVMALFGLFLAFRKKGTLRSVFRLGQLAWLVIIGLSVLYAMLIIFIPLTGWDARSIWFLHGKMIFYNSQIMNAAAGWDKPFAAFSHVDYPKLVPILAAQFAALAGFWNEYFPKAGLIVLLVPALIGLFSFIRKPGLSGVYLLTMALFTLGGWLWNGYMDGYLALYSGLACLFLGRWLTSHNQLDALSGIAALAVTVALKNEGLLLLVCATSCLTAICLTRGRTKVSFLGLIRGRTWFVVVAAFLGSIIWLVLKYRWHLSSDMPSSPTDLQLITTRLQHGAVGIITDTLLFKAEIAKAAVVLAGTIIAVRVVKKRISIAVWYAVWLTMLYSAAMFWIYLTTNFDLSWHLGTSATRTMLPVLILIIAATFLCLFDLEEPEELSDKP